jgi:hypothetical protein
LEDIPPKDSAGESNNDASADEKEGGSIGTLDKNWSTKQGSRSDKSTLYSPWIDTEESSFSFSDSATGSTGSTPSDADQEEQKSWQPSRKHRQKP